MCYSHHNWEVRLIPEREALFLILVTASLCDITWYRVPNSLIVPAVLFSLFRHISLQGFGGILPWLLGMLVPFILCFIFYRYRMIGASDSKMYPAVCRESVGQNIMTETRKVTTGSYLLWWRSL